MSDNDKIGRHPFCKGADLFRRIADQDLADRFESEFLRLCETFPEYRVNHIRRDRPQSVEDCESNLAPLAVPQQAR